MKKNSMIVLVVIVVLGVLGGVWYHHNYRENLLLWSG